MGAGSVPAEAVGRAVYAIPRAELYMKTANFQETKRSTRTRHVCIHVAHFLVSVLVWGLAMPLEDMNFEDAPLYFCVKWSGTYNRFRRR